MVNEEVPAVGEGCYRAALCEVLIMKCLGGVEGPRGEEGDVVRRGRVEVV